MKALTTSMIGWEVRPALQTEDYFITISNEAGRIVALVCTEHPVEPSAEEQATAKLICALPELIGAAMTAYYGLQSAIANEPSECVGSSARDSFQLLGSALKKAGVL